MANIGSGGELIISGYIATSASDLPEECTRTDDDYGYDDDNFKEKKVAGMSSGTLALVIIAPVLVFSMMFYVCCSGSKSASRRHVMVEGELVESNGIAMTVRQASAVVVNNNMNVVTCDNVRIVGSVSDHDEEVGGDKSGSVSDEDDVAEGLESRTNENMPVAQAQNIIVASPMIRRSRTEAML
jgi:hypothetical protein